MILENLSIESKEKLKALEEDEIYNKLNNNDLYKIEEYNPNNISYDSNIGFLSK